MSVRYTQPVPRFGCKLYNDINNVLSLYVYAFLSPLLRVWVVIINGR